MREIIGYELTMNIRGPEFYDRLHLESENIAYFEGVKEIELGGNTFVRFQEEGELDYVDVRADWICDRKFVVVYREDDGPIKVRNPVSHGSRMATVKEPEVGADERPKITIDKGA